MQNDNYYTENVRQFTPPQIHRRIAESQARPSINPAYQTVAMAKPRPVKVLNNLDSSKYKYKPVYDDYDEHDYDYEDEEEHVHQRQVYEPVGQRNSANSFGPTLPRLSSAQGQPILKAAQDNSALQIIEGLGRLIKAADKGTTHNNNAS